MLPLVILITLAMGITGCEKKCPKPIYPSLEAINKIPYYNYYVINGTMDQNSTKKAFSSIKALRVSEHYYYSLIVDYRKEFVIE